MYFCTNVSLHEFILLGSPEAAVNEKEKIRVSVLHVLIKCIMKFHGIFGKKYYVVEKKVYGNFFNFNKILETFVLFI